MADEAKTPGFGERLGSRLNYEPVTFSQQAFRAPVGLGDALSAELEQTQGSTDAQQALKKFMQQLHAEGIPEDADPAETPWQLDPIAAELETY